MKARSIGWLLLSLLPGCVGGASADPPPFPSAYFPDATATERIPCAPPFEEILLASRGESPAGLYLRIRVRSRSGPFSVETILDARAEILDVRISDYRADRGKGVLSSGFTSQFTGKGPESDLRLGKEVHAVARATLSSRAVADGVAACVRKAGGILQTKGP